MARIPLWIERALPRGGSTAFRFGTAVAVVAVGTWAARRLVKANESPALVLPEPSVPHVNLYTISRAEVTHALSQLGGRAGDTSYTRNPHDHGRLMASAGFVEDTLESAGWATQRQSYVAHRTGRMIANLVAERKGRTLPDQIVVVAARYDALAAGRSAHDSATPAAALLALARALGSYRPDRTLRVVAFTNEEPPHTRTSMGSLMYAQACRERSETIHAMISIESITSTSKGGVTFVANLPSRHLAQQCAGAFRLSGLLEAKAITLPSFLPGVRSSDSGSFWQVGFPAVMVTDNGPLRVRMSAGDKDGGFKVHAERVAQVAEGLLSAVKLLAGGHDA